MNSLVRPKDVATEKTSMLTKFDFELKLEQLAERFYFNAAAQMTAPRGGNSRGNEVYFGNVSPDLRASLGCQQIILPKGECPDSGVFGSFNYLPADEVNWEAVKGGKAVALEVAAPHGEKRYIEIRVSELTLPAYIEKDTDIHIKLNEVNGNGEFFGIEYKACKNKNPNRIQVASFNSTCPSATKTTTLGKVLLVHNLPTSMRSWFDKDKGLRKCRVRMSIQFSMYYFIVNDFENGTRSEIKHIFLCSGGFFAPTTSEAEAEKLSAELKPGDLEIETDLYRVSLRFRPFFDSKAIRSNGYGLYTSWEPKIPGMAREERERQALLKEVEKIQQTFQDEPADQITQPSEKEFENVIYLTLREERIRKRSVA